MQNPTKKIALKLIQAQLLKMGEPENTVERLTLIEAIELLNANINEKEIPNNHTVWANYRDLNGNTAHICVQLVLSEHFKKIYGHEMPILGFFHTKAPKGVFPTK